MLAYIVRRLLLAVFTVWMISIISFVIIDLPPGDYVTNYVKSLEIAEGLRLTDEEREALRASFGVDQPLPVRYVKWIGKMLTGDFGISLEWRRPVGTLIGERLGLTVIISLAAVIFTWIVSLPIGIYSAVRQYSIADYVFTFIGFLGLAIPDFLLALLLMYFGWMWLDLSIGGLFSPEYMDASWSLARVGDLLAHLPIPAIVLGTSGTAGTIRILRANLLDELSKPYVVSARARGMPETWLVLKYPVRVALNPFASTIGYLFPSVVSGSIIVSVVLSLPTVGPILLGSLISQDMFLAATIILMLGVLTVIGTLISDFVLLWIDPRIRFEGR